MAEQELKRIPNWEKIWHSGMDYVAPGHEVGSHPMERGEVDFIHRPDPKLIQRSSIGLDIARAKDYDQEPLPGQWLIYPS